MNAVGAIRKIILDDATSVALLFNSTSVYPIILPQQKEYPAITLMLTDSKPNDSKTQTSPIDNVAVAVTIFGKTYDKVQQIDTAIRAAIDGFEGTVTTSDFISHYIDGIRFLSRKDDFDTESVLFVRQCIYDVRYYISPSTLPYTTQIQDWMDTLLEFSSDAAAGAGGIVIGNYYMTNNTHESLPGGVAKMRKV